MEPTWPVNVGQESLSDSKIVRFYMLGGDWLQLRQVVRWAFLR